MRNALHPEDPPRLAHAPRPVSAHEAQRAHHDVHDRALARVLRPREGHARARVRLDDERAVGDEVEGEHGESLGDERARERGVAAAEIRDDCFGRVRGERRDVVRDGVRRPRLDLVPEAGVVLGKPGRPGDQRGQKVERERGRTSAKTAGSLLMSSCAAALSDLYSVSLIHLWTDVRQQPP